jgi:hypothetical protein
VAVRNVRWEPPYAASTSLIGWLAGEPWIEAAGEYAFYNGGAFLGDVPTPRLVEIAYFLAKRQILSGVVEKEVVRARERALNQLDGSLHTAGTDDDTGLPEWVVQSGVNAADGSTPFT